ncbi:glycosyltransferase [Bryobacter aggregatus]|uniref:glycosyltransferase n=1 Tax=Bryobacter aggregatus TaxID=360054 RepID=UPI0004E26F08|nr:glycosyltransferase [Bryobacter aggregatus]
MPKLDFVFFDAGGGHRAAATALKQACAQHYPDWQVRLVNLQEELDSLDIFRKLTGIRMEDVYNLVLRKGWTLGSPQLLVAMHALIRLYHPLQVRKLKEFWSQGAPDLLVSLIPNFNRALYQSIQAVSPRTRMVTSLTDLADYPPHFWIERNQQQYFICGTAKAAQQAKELGHASDRIFRVSGMVLHPRFYEPIEIDRDAERRTLGLDPKLPTGILLFGGYGSAVMRKIAKRLDDSGIQLQLLFICGKNAKLRAEIEALNLRMPHHIEGFTTRIPHYMKLADFLIGKPGPGSISEAIQMGLPVIVTRNALTLPQERYNADWVTEHGLGLVLQNYGQIVAGVQQMLAPGSLERFRNNASKMDNRAIDEIPKILERLLSLDSLER